MPQQQHRGSRRHHRVRVGVAGVVITVCVLLGTAQTLSVLSVPPPAGATTAGGPLQVTMGTFDGDAVTTTPIGSVLAGSDVTYQVAVTNTGTSTQTNVLVPVTLVSSFSLHPASVSISAGTTSTGGGVLSWSAGSLAGGETATLTYTETADAPSSLESDSTTAAATSDQSTAPSTTTTGLGVVPAADLEIAVSDGVDTVAPGASDTYTITLTDDGPSAVTNATVTDTFSSDVGALGGSSSLGEIGRAHV